jgi:hypothetical protein
MTDEARFALQLGLNLIAVLLAGWLAGHYAARRIQQVFEAERKCAKEMRRQAQAEVRANLLPILPDLEQLVEVERWVLTARDLQILLTSICTLVRIRLGADKAIQLGVSTEIDQSLKYLGRQENKWLNDSLPVVAFVRQIDPAKRKTQDQSLETWVSRINQAYVRSAQSLRRAASLCGSDDDNGVYDASMANAYLTEADQAVANMGSMIASGIDRAAYVRQQLSERQAQQISAAVAERGPDAPEVLETDAFQFGGTGLAKIRNLRKGSPQD